jgi:hypothetical protein
MRRPLVFGDRVVQLVGSRHSGRTEAGNSDANYAKQSLNHAHPPWENFNH